MASSHERNRSTALRPEASSLAWVQMTGQQHQAFDSICSLLAQATTTLRRSAATDREEGDQGSNHELEAPPNLVCLLDGDRGTGKTSLLLTLMQNCGKTDSRGLVGPAGIFRGLDKEKEATLIGILKAKLAPIRGRLVWLETLDMEPLPSSTNLLAAILARIERSIEKGGAFGFEPFASSGSALRGGLLDPVGDERQVMMEFQRLQADVALAWDGNLLQRQAHLDPDPFAVEVRRAEFARLDLTRRLKMVVDALAEQLSSRGQVSNPVFVLPVDDFDLNPARCLDLMKLIRMARVPRLFTLVLGSQDMAQRVFKQKIIGDLMAVRGQTESPDEEILKLASEVSAKAIRKLFPPSQRVELSGLSVAEALDFRPLDQSETLEQILGRLQAPAAKRDILYTSKPDAEPSFRDFFLGRWVGIPVGGVASPNGRQGDARDQEESGGPNGTNNKIERDRRGITYRATGMLQLPPRPAIDLWMKLQRLACELEAESGTGAQPVYRRWTAIMDAIAGWTKEMAGEELFVSSRAQKQIAETLVRHIDGEWEFDSSWLAPVAAVKSVRTLDVGVSHIVLGTTRPGGLHPGEKTSSNKETDHHEPWLPRRVSASLALVHDLASLTNVGLSTNPYLANLKAHYNLVKVVWRLPSLKEVSLHWWPPEWHCFWEADQLEASWSRLVYELSPEKSDETDQFLLQYLFYHWVAVCTSVFSGSPWHILWDELPKSDVESYNDNLATRLRRLVAEEVGTGIDDGIWTTVADELVCHLGYYSRHFHDDWKMRFWFMRIALMLAPEAGLPSNVARGFLKNDVLREIWKSYRYREPYLKSRQHLCEAFVQMGEPALALLLFAPRVFEARVRDAGRKLTDIALKGGVVGEFLMGTVPEIMRMLDGGFKLSDWLTPDLVQAFGNLKTSIEKINKIPPEAREPWGGGLEFSMMVERFYELPELLEKYKNAFEHPYSDYPDMCLAGPFVDDLAKKYSSYGWLKP
jgi:hypothetical protein